MSQDKVLRILEELGGRATASQIRKEAMRRYPRTTLYTYTTKRLKSLQKWGIVKEDGEFWVVVGKSASLSAGQPTVVK